MKERRREKERKEIVTEKNQSLTKKPLSSSFSCSFPFQDDGRQ